MNGNNILTYPKLLKEIEEDNHLLLANGFNQGFGVNTSYYEIFKKMMEDKCGKIYEDAQPIVEECNYDLELFIAKLNESINDDNEFLKKYVSNKVKLDFMKAAQEIVKESIKNVYSEQNEGIFLLLNNFTNYFTLNYDSFLYLLLLNFKKIEKGNTKEVAIGFTPQLKFIQEDLDQKQSDIYSEIKKLRENGTIDISSGENSVHGDLSNVTKSEFVNQVKLYSKGSDRGWKVKDIKKVAGIIWEEEKNNQLLEKVDDGFKQTYLFDAPVHKSENNLQNLFFLHGAFHIYENKDSVLKITSTQDKALYSRLEEVLNDDELEICTVFQPTDKIKAINDSKYLSNCLNKLGKLTGNIVIIGSSLDENDNHIFDAINNSDIENVYVSFFRNYDETISRTNSLFLEKNVYLFDAETISYSLN